MKRHNKMIFIGLMAFAPAVSLAPLHAQEVAPPAIAPASGPDAAPVSVPGAAPVSAPSVAFAAPVPASALAEVAVTGEGVVEAAPDMATVSLGVTRSAETASAAMEETAAELAKVLANLKAAGIDARDLQTSGLSLQPELSTNSGQKRINRFTARNQVTVTVRKLSELGDVLGAAIADGANTLDNVSFGVADPGPLLDEARLRAVADARHRAEVVTGAAGVRLGQITAISEQGGFAPAPRGAMLTRAALGGVPIEAGELSFTVAVSIRWQIVQ